MLLLKDVKFPDSNFVNFPKVGAHMVTPPSGPVREVLCTDRGTVLPVLVIGFLDSGIPERVSCRLFLPAPAGLFVSHAHSLYLPF